MSRERRALAAFLLLAALATLPAMAIRPGSSRPAAARQAPTHTSPASVRSADATEATVVSERRAARRAAAAAQEAEAAAALLHGDPALVCTEVPRYPAARRIDQRRNPALLRALASVPGVTLVTKMERFSLGHRAWLGAGRLPDIFRFYEARMHPVGFEEMSPAVRRVIGVRSRGDVDSPPLLYTNRTGAVLVQGRAAGEVRLTLFCGPVEV